MKYYETHYEEYLQSMQNFNLHPELDPIFNSLPAKPNGLDHMIVYGASGVGKYSQVLRLLNKYSSLKYEKKVKVQTDKLDYTYKISDIHYEIDMALLGCNSKLIWHEAFFQIVDIVSVKPDKVGVIVCKNFHAIHNELLDVFYSYMQHAKTVNSSIQLKFILLTEHVSFIPNNILSFCNTICVRRPNTQQYANMCKSGVSDGTVAAIPSNTVSETQHHEQFLKRVFTNSAKKGMLKTQCDNIHKILSCVDSNAIMNAKELNMFSMVATPEQIPKDIFNIICDNIIREIENHRSLKYAEFRDSLYDVLVYNLDISDCLWYVLNHFIQENALKKTNMNTLLDKIHVFLKQFNNNYRPIYHLESIFYTILTEVHQYP